MVFSPVFTFSSSIISHWLPSASICLLPLSSKCSSYSQGGLSLCPSGLCLFHIPFLPTLCSVWPCWQTHALKTHHLASTTFPNWFSAFISDWSLLAGIVSTPPPKCRTPPGSHRFNLGWSWVVTWHWVYRALRTIFYSHQYFILLLYMQTWYFL